MAFVEIEKTSARGGPTGTHATFSITKTGTGTIRINKEGVSFMLKNRIRLIAGDTIKVLHDPETGKLAIMRSSDGQFRLTAGSAKSGTLRVSSKDLADTIKKNNVYDMECDLSDMHFDVILVPKGKEREEESVSFI